MKTMRGLLFVLFCTSSPVFAVPLINSWTNPVSGNWEDLKWSLGIRPGAGQSIMLTNQGWKAVAINPSTPVNFPDSMTVSDLVIRGAWDTENTLLLNYAGTATPLTVLNGVTLQDYGRIVNFNSGLVVQGGPIIVTNSQMIQDGGFVSTTNAQMFLRNAVYSLTNGVFEGGSVSIGPQADFTQWNGSNRGDIFMSGGSYHMNGGLAQGANLSTEAGSGFYHTNGMVEYSQVEIRGADTNSPDGSSYQLQGGALHSGTLRITANGELNQQSGTCVVTNGFYLQGDTVSPQPRYFAQFYKGGGSLFTTSIVVSNFSQFQQGGGTTQVAGDVSLSGGNLWLGSRMTSVNLVVGQNSFMEQGGGTNEVIGVLSITGQYNLTGGRLSVNGIYLRGTFNIYYQPVLINSGVINFGGRLAVSVSQSSVGSVALATNGSIGLANSVSLRFADSSANSWNPNCTLVIESWGWGAGQHIYFGTNSSGLTASQLAQVRFFTPHWLPEGYYPARILSTGEIVPAPTLQSSGSGHDLTLWWSDGYQLLTATNVGGPYQPVSGATSPYTFDMRTDPQRFFRIMGPN